MNRRIELRAIVRRDDRILLVREQGAPTWDLPGGAFDDDAEDIDAAMDSLLRGIGIVSPNTADDFLRTDHHRDGETQVIVNLYVPATWEGQPAPAPGEDARWFEMDGTDSADIGRIARESIEFAYGLREAPEVTLPGALAGAVAPPSDRHLAGLDVLRTLGATDDPSAAFEAMARRTPEIASDVVDFALGEVWSTAPLDRKTRSLQVVAMLAALGGRGGPLRSHMNGALNHGATPDQLVETLRMVAVYAGFPAALEAWPVMEDVFAARGIARPGREPQ